jgi:hypothetical protein
MPRYFFSLFDVIQAVDQEGLELPDLKAAEATGLASARAVAAEHVGRGRLTLSHRIEIADANGVVLKTIRFNDAVEVLA